MKALSGDALRAEIDAALEEIERTEQDMLAFMAQIGGGELASAVRRYISAQEAASKLKPTAPRPRPSTSPPTPR